MKTKQFKDITKRLLANTTPNSHEIKELNYWIINNKIVKVDGKNVVLDYSKSEKEIALWLESTFGGKIYLCPRINKPDGIQTPDYLWNNEKWDLKEIIGNGKNILFHAVEDHENQAHNYIFDISKSQLTNNDIIERLEKLYYIPKIKWINKIIIKRTNEVIIITKRSSPSD